MKVAVCHDPGGRAEAWWAETAAGIICARFGDDVLIAAESEAWTRLVTVAQQERLSLRDYDADVAPARLHLVTQIGGAFQREHPDVPVILNKGRYLAVEMDPARARGLSAAPGACYAVRPLSGRQVVFAVPPAGAQRAGPVAWITGLVDQVTRARLEADLNRLTSFPTRHATSTPFRAAAGWAGDTLRALGYAVRTERVQVGSGTSLNVIADKPGRGPIPRGLVIVGAHLDSINLAGGPAASAPGADDNGSGSAGVLEMARLFNDQPTAHDLRFILFGGEEEGLFGSTRHVARLTAAERARIRAVVTMDMIATRNTPTASVLLEGAAVSRAVIDGLADAAATYTTLSVQTSLNPFNSDHVPFIDAGLRAVLTIEGTDSANHNIHTAGDTLGHIDYDLMIAIVRMNVAFIAHTAGRQGEPPMSDTHRGPHEPGAITSEGALSLLAALRGAPFQFSGRYAHNGGVSGRQGHGFVDAASGHSTAALHNPIYRLEEPVFRESPDAGGAAERAGGDARFTLAIDIDGTDPLGVVSGTTAAEPVTQGASPLHFIGRVTANQVTSTGRTLTVGDFTFRWPGGVDTIDRLTIALTGSALVTPTATVTFQDTGRNHEHGPYTATQVSTHFRAVEMDVDREAGAVDVEPVSTRVHPDCPADLPEESLTLERAFAKAGIRITRAAGSGTVIDTSAAGANKRWNYTELHDSMRLHWAKFANKPQWKMWIFLADLADSDGLGGVMFDGDIDEPGGVDRQGTAIFTRCPYFHTVAGAYIKANPPGAEAVKRELFFNLIHETGHAFNLAHSFQKQGGGAWRPPAWMPLLTNNQALSWMNYPDSATPSPGAGANASWFYRRFRFRFDDGELLFLRHAPERYVEMGGTAWFQNHGRVARVSVDPRLQLIVRSRRPVVELAEPVMIELKLKNIGDQPAAVHGSLDPSDGLVELAVTNPRGERRPFLPIDHTRTVLTPRVLQPDGEALYGLVDLTMGTFGFPFKEPGAYRIEASYTNIDGGTAAAVMQLYVRRPANDDVVPVVNELFNARIGSALYCDGTRVMGDVNEKLEWVRERLAARVGEDNPIAVHLTTTLYLPMASPTKVVTPGRETVTVYAEEPDRVVQNLESVMIEHPAAAADTMGHIWYRDAVNTYTAAAVAAGERDKARSAQAQLLGLFKSRGVVESVVRDIEARAARL